MKTLTELAEENRQWSLEELVELANQLLPQFLPQDQTSNRIQEEVNPRLVRHYSYLGVVEKPLKEGREARYTYRHLLQLLAGRRLLMEGFNANAISGLIASKENQELESILQGGVRLTVEAANPALAFLSEIRDRSAAPRRSSPGLPLPSMALLSATDASRSYEEPKRWIRLELLPELELHVREDFAAPSSAKEQENLLRLMGDKLFALAKKWRKS